MVVTLDLMLQILQNVIVPVFIVIVPGFVVRRLTSIESRSLSDLILYIFTPSLVFVQIAQSSLGGDVWAEISFVTLVTIFVVMALSWSIAKFMGLDQKLTSAVVLSTSLVNTGYYGLPINLLAFGERGLEMAVVSFVVSSVLCYTLGVFFASHGTQSFRESLTSVARLPYIYAVIAAFVVRFLTLEIPEPILQAVNLMGGASIPAMLVVLGMEFAPSALRSHSISWRLAGLSSAIKLLFPIMPVMLLSRLIGLEGLVRNVTVIQACMPTAVLAVVFTVKFKGNSQFVTAVTIMSTLASIVTLTLLLSFLM
jgi:hypothetical protein